MVSPHHNLIGLIALTTLLGTAVDANLGTLSAHPITWRLEWPRTDFSKHSVPFAGIKSGGPPKDGIPAIDAPRFERLADGKATGSSAALGDTEPVIVLSIGEDARAYPLRVLIWHEIANDAVGGTPVASPTARCATPRWCSSGRLMAAFSTSGQPGSCGTRIS